MFLKVDKTQVSQSNVENSFFLLKESSQLNYRIYGPVFFFFFALVLQEGQMAALQSLT